MSKVIAMDFDGCLVTNKYPDIGSLISKTFWTYQCEKANGSKFILWTCRTGEYLDAALDWCKEHEIFFDAINENVPERIEQYGGDCRKVSADEYWDDRATRMPPEDYDLEKNEAKETTSMPSIFRKPVAIDKGVYAMSMDEGRNAEITMYGEIVESQPVDGWTGKPIPGDYIIQSEFLKDLEAVGNAKSLTIHMNSLGGNSAVATLIHNRLRELAAKGTALICIVDGVAMSGGSIIMCACDMVKVNPSSLIMIHKCWSFLFGGYNADELREIAATHDAWDRAQVSVYKRKCGLDEAEITRMMAATTYMTGQEAIDKGFADTLLEDAKPLDIAASADGRSLFVRGREFHLCPGMFAPDDIPTARPEAKAPANNTLPAKDISLVSRRVEIAGEGGKKMEDNNVQTPATQEPSPAPAVDQVAAERQRLQEIDAIAALYDPELVQAAKYGENPCTAQELAYQAAVAAATKAAGEGKAFMAAMAADSKAVAQVGAAPVAEPPKSTGDMTPERRMADARNEVKALLGRKEG